MLIPAGRPEHQALLQNNQHGPARPGLTSHCQLHNRMSGNEFRLRQLQIDHQQAVDAADRSLDDLLSSGLMPRILGVGAQCIPVNKVGHQGRACSRVQDLRGSC